MSELDEKLNSILSNPQMMQQIMSLAQSLNQADAKQENSNQNSHPSNIPLNPSMLSRFSNIMQHGTIDQNQQSLLKALSPYLSNAKIQKLEKAMHAAKMASLASEMTNNRNSKTNMGR